MANCTPTRCACGGYDPSADAEFNLKHYGDTECHCGCPWCDDCLFKPSFQRMKSDIELLTAAIEASGLSARRFAMEVLGVDERSVRRWLAGDRELQATARVVCQAIIARPKLAEELSAVTLAIQEQRLSGR
jgi:hypothetical protein